MALPFFSYIMLEDDIKQTLEIPSSQFIWQVVTDYREKSMLILFNC